MKVNLFTGYCPKEMYGLARYDKNLIEHLKVDTHVVCINRTFLPIDILRYRFAKYADADISHVTNETFALVLGAIRGKKVATVFDMGVLVLKDEYGPLQRFFYSFNLAELKKADHIITASKYMRNLLIEKFGFDKNKITVIYLGIEPKFISKPKEYSKKECYQVLYVGNEKLHKNFMQVLETMRILNRHGCYKLVKVGRPQSNNRKMHVKFAEQNNIDVRFIDYVDDDTLIDIYKNSDVFITMSDYEGFCFPPLEAAACGIPIVAKNSATIQEIYGHVAKMVSTPEEAAKKIIELTSSKTEYEAAAKRANDFARKMTWEKCAKEIEKIYEKVVKL